MMNLDEHKVYVESHKMDMIPYTIVVKAIEEMQKHTRHFAKRQVTWINNQIDDKVSDTKEKILDTMCIKCEKFLKNIS